MQSRGIFTASRIGDLLASGTGKTRLNYIFEIAEANVGAKKSVSTKAMMHGIVNEVTAVQILCSIHGGAPNFADEKQAFYYVNDRLGATPDAIGLDWVGDAKCQFEILNFFEQNERLPKKYYLQVQTQMMALKCDKGYLINYLTKPEEWGEDEWTEYPFPLEDRYFIHEIHKDEEQQYNILKAVEDNFHLIGLATEMLLNAKEVDDYEFFMTQYKDRIKYQKLKDTNWERNEKEVIRYKNNFYTIK